MQSLLIQDNGTQIAAWVEDFAPDFSLSEHFASDGFLYFGPYNRFVIAGGLSLVVDGVTEWRCEVKV